MNALQKKIEALNEDKRKIDEKIKALQKQNHEELVKALDILPLLSIDRPTLMGGLDFILSESKTNKEQAEVWRQAGLKFCKVFSSSKARKVSSRSPQTSGEKE